MIIDTSAILAILRAESDADVYARAIRDAPVRRISSANLLEASMVIEGSRNPISAFRFDEFMQASGIVVEPVTEEHARIGRAAFRDFGKGSGHRAHLNFGDCFAYALSKTTGEPLLFKGNDFTHTDLRAAV